MVEIPPPTPPAHAVLRTNIAAAGHAAAHAARELGCTPGHLSKILRGECIPTDPFRYRAERLYGVAFVLWDPRSRDRDALVRAGYRPRALAREVGIRPSIMLTWWRGGDVPEVVEAIGPILARLG